MKLVRFTTHRGQDEVWINPNLVTSVEHEDSIANRKTMTEITTSNGYKIVVDGTVQETVEKLCA